MGRCNLLRRGEITIGVVLLCRACLNAGKNFGGLLPLWTYNGNGHNLITGQQRLNMAVVQYLLKGLGVVFVF